MLVLSAGFLLSGCGPSDPEVVATPIAPKKVPDRLLVEPALVECLPATREFTIDDLENAISCETKQRAELFIKLKALQKAVRSREAIAARAKAAAK